MIVQVGKKIWPDQLEGIKHQLFVSPHYFTENIKESGPRAGKTVLEHSNYLLGSKYLVSGKMANKFDIF